MCLQKLAPMHARFEVCMNDMHALKLARIVSDVIPSYAQGTNGSGNISVVCPLHSFKR